MDHRGVQCKVSYLISIPAAIKISQVVCGIIMCCTASVQLCMDRYSPDTMTVMQYCGSYNNPLFAANGEGFIMFVGALCVIVTSGLIIAYMLELNEHVTLVPWIPAETIYTGIATALYFVAAIMQSWYAANKNAAHWGVQGYWISSAVFGFIAWLLYLTEIVFRLLAH